jgi:hypothetical protein
MEDKNVYDIIDTYPIVSLVFDICDKIFTTIFFFELILKLVFVSTGKGRNNEIRLF